MPHAHETESSVDKAPKTANRLERPNARAEVSAIGSAQKMVPGALIKLQRSAGNGAVARIVETQRTDRNHRFDPVIVGSRSFQNSSTVAHPTVERDASTPEPQERQPSPFGRGGGVTDRLDAEAIARHGMPATRTSLAAPAAVQREFTGVPGVEVVGNQVKLGGVVQYMSDPQRVSDWGELRIGGTFGFNGFVDFGGVPTPPGRTWQDNTAQAKKGSVKELALRASLRVFESEAAHPVLEAVDIEPEVGAGGAPKGEPGGSSFALAVGVKLKFSQGLKVGAKVNLVKVATKGGPSPETGGAAPAAFEVQGPALEGEIKRDLPLAKIFTGKPFGEGVKYDGIVTFSGKGTLQINKTKLAAEIVKKVGSDVLQRYLSAAADVGQAVRNILASGPAVVGILGAYITIKATLATLEEGDEERRIADAASAATDGYVAGFMNGIGLGMSGGHPAWFADAKAKGAAAKAAIVTKIQTDPQLQQFQFSREELMGAIDEGLQAHKDEFHKELYGRVKPQIAALYIQKWKANLSWWEKTFTNEEKSGERNIRTRMSLPYSGELPTPEIGEPPPGPAGS